MAVLAIFTIITQLSLILIQITKMLEQATYSILVGTYFQREGPLQNILKSNPLKITSLRSIIMLKNLGYVGRTVCNKGSVRIFIAQLCKKISDQMVT